MSAPLTSGEAAEAHDDERAEVPAAASSSSGLPPRSTTRAPGLPRREVAGLALFVALGVAVLTPWLAYLGNLGFAPVIGSAGLLSLPVFAKARRPLAGVWCLLLLLIWALASYAWSPLRPGPGDFSGVKALQRITGLKLAVELALFSAFVLNMGRLAPGMARQVTRLLALGLVAMAGLVLIDALTHAAVYQRIREAAGAHARPDLAVRDVGRAGFILVMLFWPTLLTLRRDHRQWAVVVFTGLVVADCLIMRTDAALLALATSAIVAGVTWRYGRPGAWLLLAGVVALYAATPVVVALLSQGALAAVAHSAVSKASWGERLKIWSFVLKLVEAKPFLGWGLDASRAWPGLIPLHPHNVALQVWLELGLPGAALATLFWCLLAWRIGGATDGDRAWSAVCAGTTAAYLTDGAIGFGVWQDWWLAIGALAAACCLLVRAWPAPETRAGGRALQPL